MTGFGVPQGEQGSAYAPPRPVPATQPVATVFAAPAALGSTAAAREAALTALATARSASQPPSFVSSTGVGPGPGTPPPPPSPPSPPPSAPGKRRTAGPLGAIRVLQIVCWQLMLVAVVLVLDQRWPTIAAVGVAAAVVVALTAVRVRGRWLYEWVALCVRYLLRDRVRDLTAMDGSGPALLRLISPETTGIDGTVNGDPVYMVSRAAGITAVLQPTSTTLDSAEAMPAPQQLLPAQDEQALAFVAQVIHHAGLNRARHPRIWVALQALRTVDVHRDADVQQVLGNAVRRVRRRLRRDGLPVRPLAEYETLGMLAALAHVNAGRGQVRERWRQWHSGPITQAAFRLDGWSELTAPVAAQLLRWLLTAAPQAAVTVSVTARQSPADVEPVVTASMRIASVGPAALESASGQLSRLVRAWGVSMARLDGEHAWGMAHTLPIGIAH